MNGYGKYYNNLKDAYYEGQYKDGLKHGSGTIRYKNYSLKGVWCEGDLKAF